MSPQWIEVDDEVMAKVQGQARPFVDSPNDALRGLLGLGGGERELRAASLTGAAGAPVAGAERRAVADGRVHAPAAARTFAARRIGATLASEGRG